MRIRIYYKREDNGDCLETCHVHRAKCKIGSITCRRCSHCIGANDIGSYPEPEIYWIECDIDHKPYILTDLIIGDNKCTS